MQVNFLGVLYTLKAALPGMVARNKGRIVVTNSPGGFMGDPQFQNPCQGFAGLNHIDSGVQALVEQVKLPCLMTDTAPAGAAGISAYCASKHAVRGLLDSLRMEVGMHPESLGQHAALLCFAGSCVLKAPAYVQLLHTDVTLHMACPSFVNTSMIRAAQQDAVTPEKAVCANIRLVTHSSIGPKGSKPESAPCGHKTGWRSCRARRCASSRRSSCRRC